MAIRREYSAKLLRVVDGDTCDAMIDLGFKTWVKKRIRFKGVDTWESRTRDLEEKKLVFVCFSFVFFYSSVFLATLSVRRLFVAKSLAVIL